MLRKVFRVSRRLEGQRRGGKVALTGRGKGCGKEGQGRVSSGFLRRVVSHFRGGRVPLRRTLLTAKLSGSAFCEEVGRDRWGPSYTVYLSGVLGGCGVFYGSFLGLA